MEPLLRVSQDEMARSESTTQLESELHKAIEVAASRDAAKLAALAADVERAHQEGEHAAAVSASAQKLGPNADAVAVAGELSLLESRLKELLLRERVRKAVAEYEERTRVPRAGGYALIIDGPCLRAAMHPDNKWTFLKLGVRCKAVVCCRVTPAQKAEVTLLVKDNVPGKTTLAIGDGANDVSMIQVRHLPSIAIPTSLSRSTLPTRFPFGRSGHGAMRGVGSGDPCGWTLPHVAGPTPNLHESPPNSALPLRF
jgi:hypothetical protein